MGAILLLLPSVDSTTCGETKHHPLLLFAFCVGKRRSHLFTWRQTLMDAERGRTGCHQVSGPCSRPRISQSVRCALAGKGIPNLRPEIHLQEKISRKVWISSVPGLAQVPGEKVGGYNCGKRYLTESSTDSGDGGGDGVSLGCQPSYRAPQAR